MTEVLAVLGALIFFLLASRMGITRTIAVVVLASLLILPRTLFVLSPDGGFLHVGISSLTPAVTTYGIVLLAALVSLVLRWGLPRELLLWLPFTVWLLIGWTSEWADSPIVLAGILHYAVAATAWTVGILLGRRLAHDEPTRRFVTGIVLLLFVIQALVITLQAAGISINPMSASNEAQLAGRFNGTLGHPNDLGKVVLLSLVLVLPLHATKFGVTFSRRLVLTLASGFLVLLMTGGRAVIIGAAVTALFWVLLQPGLPKARTHKGRAIGASLVGGGIIALTLAERFEKDPTGGARSVLSDLAIQQIALRPLWGTGPNQYMEVVGAVDPLTASGVPVHNAFLLATAELGLPGALLLALPFVWCIVRALFNVRISGPQAAWSRVIIAACPALILIGMTGWGLLGGYVFPLLCLVFGAASGATNYTVRKADFVISRANGA